MRAALFVAPMIALAACSADGPSHVTVFAAASMRSTLEALRAEWSRSHPETGLRFETSASRLACAKVADQGRRADLVISADAALIDDMLRPRHARFNVRFARNPLVIAYNPDTPGGAQLAAGEPWQRVLAGEVWVGIANPDFAPAGSRALRALQQNDRVSPAHLQTGARILARLDRRSQRPDVSKLLAPLEAGELDAAFVYRSSAAQHGFPFVELDPRIAVEASMAYGATVPLGAERSEDGVSLLRLLLSETGRAIATARHLTPITPPQLDGVAPAALGLRG